MRLAIEDHAGASCIESQLPVQPLTRCLCGVCQTELTGRGAESVYAALADHRLWCIKREIDRAPRRV